MIASSSSSKDSSIFLISIRSLRMSSILRKTTPQNTTSGTQNQKHASSYFGCTQSSRPCTSFLTKHAVSVIKLLSHCSARLPLLSITFSQEESSVEKTRLCLHTNSQILLWDVWLAHFCFSEAHFFHLTSSLSLP